MLTFRLLRIQDLKCGWFSNPTSPNSLCCFADFVFFLISTHTPVDDAHISFIYPSTWDTGFLSDSVVKNLPANAGDAGSIPWVKKTPWGRKWQPIPVFLPGKSHGQRSLAGYSPWDHKESDTTETKRSTYNWGCKSADTAQSWNPTPHVIYQKLIAQPGQLRGEIQRILRGSEMLKFYEVYPVSLWVWGALISE